MGTSNLYTVDMGAPIMNQIELALRKARNLIEPINKWKPLGETGIDGYDVNSALRATIDWKVLYRGQQMLSMGMVLVKEKNQDTISRMHYADLQAYSVAIAIAQALRE